MKKIILSIIALIAILWIAMFVTDVRILVHEEEPLTAWYEYAEEKNLNFFIIFDDKPEFRHLEPDKWKCSYLTSRKIILMKFRKSYYDSCPNIVFK